MRDGLKIYACSGLGVGTQPEEFNYWTDNTDTLTNTCAVNALLAHINFLSSKLRYQSMSESDVLTSLNLIDLYAVCLYGAEQYKGEEIRRYGRIVGLMADEGAFLYDSTDNDERDNHLDDLISEANTRFTDGEDPNVSNNTTEWFEKEVTAKMYVGLSDEQIERVKKVLNNGAIGTTVKEASDALYQNGAYYLYLYLTEKEALHIGTEVYKKWKKEKEVYEYTMLAYGTVYGGKEAADEIIYAGICDRFKDTPENIAKTIKGGKKGVGIADPASILTIVQIIATIVQIIISIVQVVLEITSAALQNKYKEPDDPELGTPGFGDESDLSEITKSAQKNEDTKTLLGIGAGALLLLYGLFK